MNTYRDCGFSSSTLDSGVAFLFGIEGSINSGISNHQVQSQFMDQQPYNVGVIYKIDTQNGFNMTAISGKPFEQEILFPPGKLLKIDQNQVKIAVWNEPSIQYATLSIDHFKYVNCDEELTETEKKNITHIFVKMGG